MEKYLEKTWKQKNPILKQLFQFCGIKKGQENGMNDHCKIPTREMY